MDKNMFCFQCEQTAGCAGCTGRVGVCGKTADTAKLQDELTGALIGLRCYFFSNIHFTSSKYLYLEQKAHDRFAG